tara:strand:+ start:546 stop:1289 length:744 start_codon:yes stop_codon:yes gene_type:complete
MLQILKIITDFLASFKNLASIIQFIKRNKLLSPFVVGCIAIISLGSFFLLVRIIDIHNNQGYVRATKINKINKYVRERLQECGDGTAISLGAVDIKKDENNVDYPYNALFIMASACDRRAKPDCIVDMHSTVEFYRKIHQIDNNSYNKFLEASKRTIFFYLRDTEKQNIDALKTVPSISKLVEGGQWFQEGKLNSLWIKSVTGYSLINPEKELIYIATLIFANNSYKGCVKSQDEILSEILTFIKMQ